jgi:hypothetical protein
MKVGLCVVGAIIQDESMLYKAINSVESLTDWDEKVILMDGLPENGVPERVEHYDTMLENLKIIKSKFTVKCFDENIYFKNMLRYLLNNYDCDFWLVIQDDVVIQKIDVWAELGAMDALEANIISYPHKKILKSNHWFDIIDDLGNGYVASHGWSERCFLMKSSSMKKLIKDDVRGENNFIDTIYHRNKNTKNWKSSDSAKDEYWNNWRCYLNNNILHKHLVGKRNIKL